MVGRNRPRELSLELLAECYDRLSLLSYCRAYLYLHILVLYIHIYLDWWLRTTKLETWSSGQW